MKVRNVTSLLGICATVLMFGATAFAQQPGFEASVDYTYIRFNPGNPYTPSRNLNGGGGDVAFFFTPMLGIKAEVMGSGSTTYTYTIAGGGFPLPGGGAVVVIPPGTYTSSGNLFTYTLGPVIKKRSGTFQPFGELLFGGAHSNVYANFYHATGSLGTGPTGNTFCMLAGGGVDAKVSPLISIRLGEFDYQLTRFGNNYTSTQNQNGFRFSAGLVLTFGQ